MYLYEKLQLLPSEPGVYLMKNAAQHVIYVGKAISLRDRVRSYFHASRQQDLKTQQLVQDICDFEYIVTSSEKEALILEDTLIKRHQPRYNIRLKDDKRYPYIKFKKEFYPRLEFTRIVERDGARYFGPYTDALAVRETMKLLQKIFRIRTCTLALGQKKVRSRPCLDHYIGLCDAPCVLAISESEYAQILDEAADFLRGRQSALLQKLEAQMLQTAEKLEFERAARLRDQHLILERLLSSQKVVDPNPVEQDLIGYARLEPTEELQNNPDIAKFCVQVFFVRGGKLIGREKFFMDAIEEASGREILTAFVKQYYSQATYIPKEILLQCEIEEAETIASWLSERRETSKVTLRIPERGPKYRLMEMVIHNAELALKEQAAKPLKSPDRQEIALQQLSEILKFEPIPRRVEAFDISHFQGHESVGSMVVLVDGFPKKSDYRRFRIKTVSGPNDFASLAEVIKRRLENALAQNEKFLPFPDLILIDGGKGQLSSARAILHELGLEKIPTCSLAKESEYLFVEGRSDPIILPRDSQALQLLQRARDEAHRFALTYHRQRRTSATLRSLLDQIPGVGPKRRQQLYQHFGSMSALRRARLEELIEVPGISKGIAQQILKTLQTEDANSLSSDRPTLTLASEPSSDKE
jgi:excinuclease ABC subunit C